MSMKRAYIFATIAAAFMGSTGFHVNDANPVLSGSTKYVGSIGRSGSF